MPKAETDTNCQFRLELTPEQYRLLCEKAKASDAKHGLYMLDRVYEPLYQIAHQS